MATYAAFKHVELYNVGSGKRRVLKPPGGGSSDIFAGSVDSASTPRSVRNHMKSNIFAAPSPMKGSSTGDARRPQQNSHNRLFGDSDRSQTPAKNRLRSNIPFGGDEADSSLKHSNGNGHCELPREHTNGGSENGKSCDSNENYSHSTDNLHSTSKYYGTDAVNLCKASNYLNPTFNSKINLCINDDYIAIVNNENNNNRNPSSFRPKRESKVFDENMNLATPLINNAHETKSYRKALNSSLPTDGNSLSGETMKPSGENVAPPSNHVVNKNRIPPGGFSSGLW